MVLRGCDIHVCCEFWHGHADSTDVVIDPAVMFHVM